MPLAPQVGNPGSRGQDSRYKLDPTFMVQGPDGRWTDGVYHYEGDAEAMLSTDRPSVAIGGVPPSDDSDSMYRFSASLRPGQVGPGTGAVKQAAAPPPPPVDVRMPKLKMGEQLKIPFVERAFDTRQPAADKFFHDFIAPLSAKYVDKAAFQKDWDAMAAGTPNFAPLRAKVAPVVAAAVNPHGNNPYGTLGPSGVRVGNVDRARAANVYNTLGPSPTRVKNVEAAIKGTPRLQPKPPPTLRAPKLAPKPVLQNNIKQAQKLTQMRATPVPKTKKK